MRTKVITVCIFFILMGFICFAGALIVHAIQGEPAVLNDGISWKLYTVGLVCGVPGLLYLLSMLIYTWFKRRKQVDRLVSGEDPNVVLKDVPRSEVERIMSSIRIIKENQERDRTSQEEERRRLEVEIQQMDMMLKQAQASMAEEYMRNNAEAMLKQQEYMKKQAEEMSRAYSEAFAQQQEVLIKANSPNYSKGTPPPAAAVSVAGADSETPAASTPSYDSKSENLDELLFKEDSKVTESDYEPLFGGDSAASAFTDDEPALPVAPKEEYDKIIDEQVKELTTARDSYAEMSAEQLDSLARALADDDASENRGFISNEEVEALVKKHKDELQEQKDAYAELTSEKIQTLAHERAVETLRSQGYMSPTQVNELLKTQKETAIAEMLSKEQIEELAHERALEIASEKMAADKESMEAMAAEMARQSTQQQIEQIAAEKARLEEERALLDLKKKESEDFTKSQLQGALLGKSEMEILQAENLRYEATLREQELREQENQAKRKAYRENRLQAELARKHLLSRPNIEKLIHKYFAEVAVCFLMDREEYKRRYGIAPYNRVIMQGTGKKDSTPTAKYVMAQTEDRLYRFSEVLVDVERFFPHPQLYGMYNELVYQHTPLVLISERLHHMYLQFNRKDFVRDYRHKPNFDNLLIMVSNHFTLRTIDFKKLFPPPYPFDIDIMDEELIIEYLNDNERQKAFEAAFPHYLQIGFQNIYQAMYVGFISAIKDKLHPTDLFPLILKDASKIAKQFMRQESAREKATSTKKRASKKKKSDPAVSGIPADKEDQDELIFEETPEESGVETLDDIMKNVPEEPPVDALKGVLEEMPAPVKPTVPAAAAAARPQNPAAPTSLEEIPTTATLYYIPPEAEPVEMDFLSSSAAPSKNPPPGPPPAP